MLNWNTKKVGKIFLQDFVLIFFLVRNVNLKHILQLLFEPSKSWKGAWLRLCGLQHHTENEIPFSMSSCF